jgi:hypothetical protein
MTRLECYKFEICLDQTKEVKELELIFVLDGIAMNESRMLDKIRIKLDKAANGSAYRILSWIRQYHLID